MCLDPGAIRAPETLCADPPLRPDCFAANDPAVQRIAVRGGEFGQQWTTRSARLKYWQRALERYAELFKDYSNDLDLEKMF